MEAQLVKKNNKKQEAIKPTFLLSCQIEAFGRAMAVEVNSRFFMSNIFSPVVSLGTNVKARKALLLRGLGICLLNENRKDWDGL
jgi:hypothetical protein